MGEPEGRKNMRKLEVEHCDLIHSHSDTVRQIQEKIPEEQEIRGLADFFKLKELLQCQHGLASRYT